MKHTEKTWDMTRDFTTAPHTDSVYGILEQGIDGYFEGEKSLDRTVDELYSGISLKQSEEE